MLLNAESVLSALATSALTRCVLFVLSRVETSPDTWIKAEERQCYPGGRALQHHPRLNTYTLTVDTVPGKTPPSLQGEVEELQKLIRSHRDNKVSYRTLHLTPSASNSVCCLILLL